MRKSASGLASRSRSVRQTLAGWVFLALGAIGGGWASPALGQRLDPTQPVTPQPPRRAVAADPVIIRRTPLDRARPYLPEWLAMAAEIVTGGQVLPGKAWFRPGQSVERLTWNGVVTRLDTDRNGSISPREFAGPPEDFQRLDRDASQSLTKGDFEFPLNALEKSRSRMIMSFADGNRDGKIKGEEYSRMIYLAYRDQITRHANFADAIAEVENRYEASVKKGFPYLTASDLRATVDQAAKSKYHIVIPDPNGDIELASRETLLKAFGKRELGAFGAGPALGQRAPGFTLPTVDGRGRVALADLLKKRPVVLIFACCTATGPRIEAGSLEKLSQRYRDRAEFLLVYVREEHPSDGWVSQANRRAAIAIPQPKDDQARATVAQQCRAKLGLTIPMVVDSVDDRVGALYSGIPNRLYLLDSEGLVAYKSGRGPFGFNPDELEQSLLLLLQAEAAPAQSAR